MGDKSRKESKFVGKLFEAKKRRDLEKVLRDERKQEKERIAEGDNFKDKDVFVTSNYRKQIEKTADQRKQLEYDDQIDEVNSVRNQRMWHGNFGKMILDQKEREYRESREHSDRQKTEKNDYARKDHRESRRSEADEYRRHSNNRKHETRDYNGDRYGLSDRSEQSGRSRKRFSQSYRDEDARGVCKEQVKRQSFNDFMTKEEQQKGKRQMKRIRGILGETTFSERERQERERRMKNIREILKKRNTPSKIKEAQERYLVRQKEGLIVPPI